MFFIRPRSGKGEVAAKPLRAEVLTKDQLAARAVELAESYSSTVKRGRGARLKRRFRENTKVLNAAYFAFSEAARNKEVLPAGAEWLLDNYHVVDEQVREISRDLPRSYYRALPKLTDVEWRGYPRVYQIACDFVSHTDGKVDTESLSAFIDSYQTRAELLIGEIWAVPIMLRLALVENLRRLADSSVRVADQRRRAEQLCQETIDKASGGADMLLTLATRFNEDPSILDHGAGHIARRLRAKGGPAAVALQWLDQQLRERGTDSNELLRLEQQAQAADQISVGNAITALKTIGSLNWREWFERVSLVDRILVADPSGIYTASDFITRDLYRHEIEQLARRSRQTETQVARELVETTKEAHQRLQAAPVFDIRRAHVGYYLIDDGRAEFEQVLKVRPTVVSRIQTLIWRRMLAVYLGAIGLVVLAGLVLALWFSYRAGAHPALLMLMALLFPLPLSEFAIHVVQWAATKLVSPKPLPKLDFEKGIPAEARSVVVIQTIVGDRESLEKAMESLEIRSIGNFDPNLSFGLLADLADAPAETLSGDLGIIHRARELVGELNHRYREHGSKFFVLFRRRLWNDSEEKFMGWERKRGKIVEFNRLIGGDEHTTFGPVFADLTLLRQTRYVITLDNDTQLPPGTAAKLIGAISHPLNIAQVDEATGVVRKGYSVIQPRVGITVQSGNSSRFAGVFSGHSGLDPYTRTVSDVYQDLFAEGSYIGKGVYNVEAFERSLKGRFPENALLSHDLIEGIFCRCGLASDIEVFDEFPARYHAQAKRQHRWMRGDWQLVPWLGRTTPNESRTGCASAVSGLGWWKLFDNLRRSLVPSALFASLILIWCFGPGSQPAWFAAILIVLAFPIYNVVWRLVFDIPFGYSYSAWFGDLWTHVSRGTQLLVMQLILLPHQAYISLHAIAVTLYRVYLSRRNMLEWETAYATERRLTASLVDFIRGMISAAMLLLPAAGLAALFAQGEAAWFAGPFFIAWFGSPIVAWWISQAAPLKQKRLKKTDESYLREVAFSTWRYFDSFLKPEYNYLVPDNLQIVPDRVVAERTSPTNISLSVLSVISAYDLGFIPATGVVDRVAQTVDTLLRLERFHGHFMNWYDIRSLVPLSPRYISAVDSGNMVGHFIAAREVLSRFENTPLVTSRHVRQMASLLRTSHRIPEAAGFSADRPLVGNLAELISALTRLRELKTEFGGSDAAAEVERAFIEVDNLHELVSWAEHLPLVKSLGERQILPKKVKEIDRILEGRTPTLALLLKLVNRLLRFEAVLDISRLEQEEAAEYRIFISKLRAAEERLSALHNDLGRLNQGLSKIIREVDFNFLYDQEKKLLVIGYNVDSGLPDNSFYDLLASEARLTSFVGIAKGDLPESHWFMLNRSLTESSGGKCLLSWGGTMFEYLMPLLVSKEFPRTLLGETYRAIVNAQRIYGRRRGVPWGVSESGYSGVDFHKTYQYRAFGIPGLGLKRGLAEDLVISPYSTAMAVVIDPREGVRNLRRLEGDGLRGEFGFYEAVDYTAERLGAGEKCHVVKSFLAHHQGMSLVSINNLLNDGIFQERFHRNPAVRACELLLQERFPTRIPILYPHQAEVHVRDWDDSSARAETSEHVRTPHTRHPHARLLSNGRFSVLLDNAGSGSLTMDSDISITRWRDDGITNNYGSYIYLRDLKTRAFWSAGYQPTRTEPEDYEVIFSPDKIEFRRRDHGITAHMEVTVSPEDNVEIRRIKVANLSNRTRELELTSFAEVSLNYFKAELAHPAFSKMFIESEFLPDYDALIFSRRPRSSSDRPLFMLHMLSTPSVWAPLQWETSRSKFIGRGRTLQSPRAFDTVAPLAGSVGTVLDPVMALRMRINLAASESHAVSFITGFGSSPEELIQLAKKYRESHHIVRAFELAWSHSDVEIRHQQFSISRVREYQRLANAIIYNVENLRAPIEILKKHNMPQSSLWRFGISGDDPIVLLVVNDPEHLKITEELLLGHEYLRRRGLRFDLVILNEYPGGYMQDFQQELDFLIKSSFSRDFIEKKGGIFLRSKTQLSDEEVALLSSAARVVFYGHRGALANQLKFAAKGEPTPARRRQVKAKEELPFRPAKEELEFPNQFGGFADNGKAYSMVVRHDQLPPQPWSNVIANPNFGFLVTESGAGYTWAGNSRENRLSPWSNDPVGDPFGEVIYVRDQESGAYWCPTPRPVRQDRPVKVRHGFGYSSFSTQAYDVFSQLTVFGSATDEVKWWQLELVNGGLSERQLEVFLYFEWLLGVSRDEAGRYLQSGFDSEKQILWAVNPFNNDYPSQLVFLGSNLTVHSYTADRREFVGRHCDLSAPLLLDLNASPSSFGLFGPRGQGIKLSNTVGAGFDSAGVLKVQLTLAPGEKRRVLFFISRTSDIAKAREAASALKSAKAAGTALEETKQRWGEVLDVVQVKTPSRKFDILVNGWLLYQTRSCRIMARSGFFQSSGALGFRDQLQDSLALLYSRPEETRNQILLHASRQFTEGDVQHWWHPPTGRGIRTRITDNYLWLPFAVAEYLQATGDSSILNEMVSYLEAAELEPGVNDAYIVPAVSSRRGSIYEHCVLALDRSFRFGAHGLPLIGSGDWNDGFNDVGIEGRGESVWLGWFQIYILERFERICADRGDDEHFHLYQSKAGEIAAAIEREAWDGKWYLRAFFDDGSAMGSSGNNECRIDSIAQSWSVISGAGLPDRQSIAVESAVAQLVNNDGGIISLLWPPFDKSAPSPGYIQGYPPGLRENGGQYTHAAAWLIWALLDLGQGGHAFELFDLINPISHTESADRVLRYRTEPYVSCGDVYSRMPHLGRGGWSWYTGSSGWLYRLAVEKITGLQLRGCALEINPCVPPNWENFEITYSKKNTSYRIQVMNPDGVMRGVKSIEVDGMRVEGLQIPLSDTDEPKAVQVKVTMG